MQCHQGLVDLIPILSRHQYLNAELKAWPHSDGMLGASISMLEYQVEDQFVSCGPFKVDSRAGDALTAWKVLLDELLDTCSVLVLPFGIPALDPVQTLLDALSDCLVQGACIYCRCAHVLMLLIQSRYYRY